MRAGVERYDGVGTRGDVLVFVSVRDGQLVECRPLSAGRRYQVRAARNVALRECWSTYRVVGAVA